MAIHFIGFRGNEVISALRVWGKPDFWHLGWDTRALREIADGDVLIFATGDEHTPPSRYTFDDIREPPFNAGGFK